MYAQTTGYKSIVKQIRQTHENEKLIELYRSLYKELEFSDVDTAIYYIKTGLNNFQEQHYTKGEAVLNALLGSAYSVKGMLPPGREYLNTAIKLYKKTDDTHNMAQAINSLGIIEGKIGNFQEAIKDFYQSLSIFEQEHDTLGIADSYLKIGVANMYSNNMDAALSFYQKSLALLHTYPVSGNYISLFNNIGTLYCKKGELKNSIPYFEKSLKLSSVPKFIQLRPLPLLNLGLVYADLGNKEKGLNYLDSALKAAIASQTPDQEIRILMSIADIADDTAMAREALEQAGALVKDNDDISLKMLVTQQLATYYRSIGQYKKALEYTDTFTIVRDSVFSMQKAEAIANLESVYELKKSNIKIDELEAANKKNTLFRNIIITIAIILATLLLLISFSLWRVRSLVKKLSESERKLRQANADKDRLFSIIGHDLRNHVSKVPDVLELYESDMVNAEERTFLMRSLKENAFAAKDTLDNLLNWGKAQLKGIVSLPISLNAKEDIEKTITLMKTASDEKKIAVHNEVDDSIWIMADEEQFKFVIRNLLSNAIKFTYNSGNIYITARKENGSVIFSVKDNGVGMDEAECNMIFESFFSSTAGTNHEQGNGIGLMLCKEFIESNGGRIWVESTKGEGSCFNFTLKTA